MGNRCVGVFINLACRSNGSAFFLQKEMAVPSSSVLIIVEYLMVTIMDH